MGLLTKIITSFGLLASIVIAEVPSLLEKKRAQMLYLMHHQKSKEALDLYLKCIDPSQNHDFELLQKIALALLEEGAKSQDQEIRLMCALAAGISQHPALFFIHRQALAADNPELQLASLSILGQMNDEMANELLFELLNSPYLILRLEALYLLARSGHADVFDKMTSLFGKVPMEVRALFAQIVSCIETPEADRFMRQLLADEHYEVRIQMLSQVSEKKLDQFLPQVRLLAKQSQVAQQEAAIITLGVLRDLESIPFLESVANSSQQMVRLAALHSLTLLGKREALEQIEKMAKEGELFAISVLGEIGESSSLALLTELSHESNLEIRTNALLALLKLRAAVVQKELDLFFNQKQTRFGVFKNHLSGSWLFGL